MDKKITIRMDNPSRHFMVPEEESNQHSFIQFRESPRTGTNTEASFLIIEQLFGKKQTRKKWKKDNHPYIINDVDDGGQPVNSTKLNYLIISKYIREKGYFERLDFNLLPIECRWLDYSMDMRLDMPLINDEGKMTPVIDGTHEQNYGKNFPIDPKLDREGRSFTNLFPLLIRRIMRIRKQLIENSRFSLTTDWFLDLRNLISDTVSIMEITLHQLYIKAEYDPPLGWKFDKEKLGERYGRRFNDKLKWVYQITGNSPHIEPYLNNCNRLRELRNHMMHFDPPSLVITVEETATWLNYIIDVGYLLIEIRKAINVPISFDLINFILQKEATFIPVPGHEKRVSLKDARTGYQSSVWP